MGCDPALFAFLPMPTRNGLCAGRHEIKTNDGELITDFIYGKIDPESIHDYKNHASVAYKHLTDSKAVDVELYITGLTSLTLAFVIAAKEYGNLKNLTFMHYDRDSGQYVPQSALALCE